MFSMLLALMVLATLFRPARVLSSLRVENLGSLRWETDLVVSWIRLW